MRRNDNAVTGLQTDQGFEDGRCGRIGSGDNCCHHADWLRNLLDAVGGIFLEYAAGLLMLVGVIDILRSKVILDDFVFYNAHAGFFHGKLCQLNTGLVGGGGSRQKDSVYLLLGVGRELLLCRTGAGCGPAQRSVLQDWLRVRRSLP